MPFPAALPSPTVPDPRSGPPLRWGIVGTGWIAERFAQSLAWTHHQVAAVGSRTQESAQRFAARCGGRPHGSYESLVADPDVDVVYVATPHPQHVENALLAIEAGKHVLVEKPMAVDAAGGQAIADAARAKGVFAMEAMWTLCGPKFSVVRRLLDDGVLGEVDIVSADIGEYFAAGHRIFDPALAGGAMMDMATYPMTLATWVLGAPEQTEATGQRGPSGTMDRVAIALRHRSGVSTLMASVCGATPTRASVTGSDAWLSFDAPWYQPGGFTLESRDGVRLRYDEPPIAHMGLFWEAVEVGRCLDEGRTESVLRPLDATIATLAAMDAVRQRVGDALA